MAIIGEFDPSKFKEKLQKISENFNKHTEGSRMEEPVLINKPMEKSNDENQSD